MVAERDELLGRLRNRLAQDADGTVPHWPAEVRAAVARALREEGVALPEDRFADAVRTLADHLAGMGPLEELLRRPGVTDVMVNGPDEVWIEQHGVLQRTEVTFDSAAAVLDAVRRAVGPTGARIDRSKPWVDARLPDGSRLHAVIAPVCADGPLVTLRRFDARLLPWASLVASAAVPDEVADLLRQAVAERECIVVCGRTGTGKTTLLQRLVTDVGEDERVVLIEDAPELRPETPHLVRLEAHPASAEGTGAVTIADLVRQALRMRPDRIVVGEVRGVELADVLQALVTGHEGCMTTVHARSGAQALVRMEGMALQAGLPVQAVHAQLGSALDLVVALDRGPGGQRGVVEIARVSMAGGRPAAEPIWQRTSWAGGGSGSPRGPLVVDDRGRRTASEGMAA